MSVGNSHMGADVASIVRASLWGPLSRLLVGVLILAIRAYQFGARPLLIGSCKFCPTCSEYAVIALRRHGVWRGGLLAARRLLRCHPFSPGGIDPVPEEAFSCQLSAFSYQHEEGGNRTLNRTPGHQAPLTTIRIY